MKVCGGNLEEVITRFDVEIARIKTSEEIQHLAWLSDGVADVAELIGEAFELGAVLVDRKIALLSRAQFRFKIDRTLQLVVEEETLDDVP